MVEQSERDLHEVEGLLLDLARVCHWSGLYQPGHPFLAERVKPVHAALASRVAREPGKRLLLGIARDRVLYRDVFLGQGNPLISHFTEPLYLRQVATLGFGEDAAPDGLLAFFRSLQDSKSGKSDESPEAFLQREQVPGIFLYPYSYKEVLSRRIVSPEDGIDLSAHGDMLWRMLLTANISGGDGEKKVVEELSGSPELIPAILRRARAFAEKGSAASGAQGPTDEESVPPEVLRRIFHRLGETLRGLPEERKKRILRFLDEGLGGMEGVREEDPAAAALSVPVSFAQALATDYTDEEFLDLLATLLSSEEKGGERLRKIFEIIAADRDVRGSLLPRLNERARESLRAKEYYAVKTWEAVEKLLLSRSEDAYLEEDHTRLMEVLSSGTGAQAAAANVRPPDPALLASFEEEARHRQGTVVLLELLAREENEAEFLDLLEEIRKFVPNLISRKEFALLETVLRALSSLREKAPGRGPDEVLQVFKEVDFGHIVDLYLSREVCLEDAARIPVFIAAFGEEAIHAVLERLLMEQEANRRRLLLSLAARMGSAAAPAILERLSDPRWYFVRNLCILLGEIGFRGAAQGLVRVLEHPDPRVRREAVLALGKLKVPETAPSLGKILLAETLFSSPKEDSLRRDAGSALFRIGGAESLGYLHRGIESRRAAVREHCSALLRSLEGQ
jgi:HEAT repeat protein